MFQNFTPEMSWPNLPGRNGAAGGGAHRSKETESVAGESTAGTEVTDATGVTNGTTGVKQGVGQGGVSLAGLSIQDLGKQASMSQSDRLKRYVEGAPAAAAGRGGLDDDARSISTAFASQVGLGGYD